MKNILIILILLTISVSLAFGQAKNTAAPKMDGCAALPWESNPKIWDVGQKLPLELKKEELVKLLRPSARFSNEISPRGEIVVGLGLKPWKYLPNASILVLETDVRVANSFGGSDSTGDNISIAVIDYTPGTSVYKVIAKTTEPFKLEDQFRFSKFDLAPYKLNDTEYAFGLRRCIIDTGTGYINSYESLDLFKLTGENIEKVFSTPTSYERLVLRNAPKSDEILKKATLSIAAEKTDGYFNLIKKLGNTQPVVFRWDGKSYQTTDKDPVPKN